MNQKIGLLVVDANILFGALLRDGTNRNLIMHGQLALHAPDWLWDELARNRAFLMQKSRVTQGTFDLLIEGLKDRIRSIPLAAVQCHIDEALARLDAKDQLDAPYVAAALAIGGGVWTHDKALGNRAGVPVYTTAEILTVLEQ